MEDSRKIAEETGVRSGKGLRLVSRAVAKLTGGRDESSGDE